MTLAQNPIECFRLGAFEIEAREHAVSAVTPRFVVGEHGLTIGLRLDLTREAHPQRGDVLDAMQAGLNQLAGIENLEVRRAWNLSRLAHIDDRRRK